MKLKFDSGLDYQLEAIKCVTDLFEGLPQQSAGFQIEFGKVEGIMFNDLGIGNNLMLSPDQLLKNLQVVQSRNHVPKSRTLNDTDNSYSFPNFSVEMETGTGKTYVYLRTIFELNQLYGFKKFIIVVPSVAIREGVTSSIKLMRDHFHLVGIKSPRVVECIERDSKNWEVKVIIRYNLYQPVVCLACGKPARIYDHRIRKWRHLDSCNHKTKIEAASLKDFCDGLVFVVLNP